MDSASARAMPTFALTESGNGSAPCGAISEQLDEPLVGLFLSWPSAATQIPSSICRARWSRRRAPGPMKRLAPCESHGRHPGRGASRSRGTGGPQAPSAVHLEAQTLTLRDYCLAPWHDRTVRSRVTRADRQEAESPATASHG
jgi:hypothetical protein